MEKVVHVHTPTKPTGPVAPTPINPVVNPQPNILKPMTPKSKNNPLPMIVIAVVVVLAGIGTGWMLSGNSSANSNNPNAPKVSENMIKTENEVGIADEEEYGEPAEGVLEEGGLDGEGTHHLVRPGGETQTVYLTSTVIDLASYQGKKVQVWGQTFEGKKAGWFMDVVKLKVI